MILFLVSNLGATYGHGGHYYSVMHIAEAVSKREPVQIVNIGVRPAPALSSWKGEIHFIEASSSKITQPLARLNGICLVLKPAVLHAFDVDSAYYASKASLRNKIPYICTKPGGPVPYRKIGRLGKLLYPVAPVQTVFHETDFSWFQGAGCQILELVRARVKRPELNSERPGEIANWFRGTQLKLLRIARIVGNKSQSIAQSISFTKLLRTAGINARLAVIGAVYSKPLLHHLESLAGEETRFFTTEEYTNRASDFLVEADVVIGTGRGFMEGCATGRVMMAPVSGANYPALVTPENIEAFEEENFSERVTPGVWGDPDKDHKMYIDIVTSPNQRDELGKKMLGLFENYYDVAKGAEQYLRLYQRAAHLQAKEHNRMNSASRRLITAYWLHIAYTTLVQHIMTRNSL